MIVYSDLDGTMVGPRGCFFRAADRSITLEPARALAGFLDGGGTLVLVSGRTRAQLQEAALIFGADGFVAELGAIVARDAGRTVDLLPTDGPPAPDDLLDAMLARFAGELEHHAPWHVGHEVDHMLRGRVDDAEVRDWLSRSGFPHLELRDNGVLPIGRPTALTVEPPIHVYHLVPSSVSKGAAVAYDLDRRGLAAADSIAIGDSTSDLTMASHVGRFFLVANGAVHLGDDLPSNVTVTSGEVGLGWAEAVGSATEPPSPRP